MSNVLTNPLLEAAAYICSSAGALERGKKPDIKEHFKDVPIGKAAREERAAECRATAAELLTLANGR